MAYRHLHLRPSCTRLLSVLCFAAGFLLSSCGKHEEAERDSHPGRAIFLSENCSLCHGEAAEGTTRAPRLAGLQEYYTKQRLVEYLSDPDAYIAKDARLSGRKSSFSGAMPGYAYLGADRLQLLADYLLTL